jgi:hypothetical protein
MNLRDRAGAVIPVAAKRRADPKGRAEGVETHERRHRRIVRHGPALSSYACDHALAFMGSDLSPSASPGMTGSWQLSF